MSRLCLCGSPDCFECFPFNSYARGVALEDEEEKLWGKIEDACQDIADILGAELPDVLELFVDMVKAQAERNLEP